MHRGILPVALAAALVLLGCAATSALRNPNVSHDPRTAHTEADTNGDGFVDHEEFHYRITEVYFHGDRDKDGYMSYEELNEVVVFQEDWSEMDSNGDERISLHEFVRVRMVIFEEVDVDDDGRLHVEEVVNAYEERGQ